MNLKKIFAAAVLCGTLSAGAFAADNYTLGIDIAGGIVGYGKTKFDGKYPMTGTVKEHTYSEVPFLPFKVNTYDCFLLNNHFGIYGSIGLLPNALVDFGVSGDKTSDPWVGIALEFMVGPAFGVDLGDSGIRFQCGVPFHAEFGAFFEESKLRDVTTKKTISYKAFGLGLTPQFRFMANRRCSLVLGADFVCDFALDMEYKTDVDGSKSSFSYDAKNAFRFKTVPYLGLGINFGK